MSHHLHAPASQNDIVAELGKNDWQWQNDKTFQIAYLCWL